jgi:hypothetical protein
MQAVSRRDVSLAQHIDRPVLVQLGPNLGYLRRT